MDLRHYSIPNTPFMKCVDLDDRRPLTENEVTTLYAAVERLIEERAEISEHIRRINQRIILSGEEIKAGGQ